MPIAIIFFDVYNTLAGFSPPREVIQQRAAAKHGFELTQDGIDAGYHAADRFMADQNSRAPVRSMDQQAQWAFFARYEQLVLEGSGHKVDLVDAAKVWEDVRSQDYGWKLFDDVVPALETLRAAGYRTAAITNMPHSGAQVSDDLSLTGLVEFVVTSGEVNAEKPSPVIFRAALQKAGLAAGAAVMVGDSIESDLDGAEAVGITGVLIDRYNNLSGHTAHPRISKLSELAAVIERLA